ncbi:hypothetical protein ACFYRY_08755 [Streptomyces sp. NPDC005263]|uniref:hypothetical protein n=1 Tax=Streptomyces sp. NPDC005263 TaxID=3364711 RepID=UPI003683AAAD
MADKVSETQAKWKEPFGRLSAYIEEMGNLASMTHKGAHMVSTHPEIMEILEGFDDDVYNEAKTHAEFAKKEMENGFPLLHAHSLMGLWGALEAAVEDLVISWVSMFPELLANSAFAKVKVPLAEFQAMSDEDRTRFLVNEVQRDLKVDLRGGVSRFEALLGAVGLDGRVDKRVKQALYDLQNVRNVWAHRGGVADRKMAKNCPHLPYTEGQRVAIDKEELNRYMQAVSLYCMTIIYRCRLKQGMPLKRPDNIVEFEGALDFFFEAKKEPSRQPEN